MINLKNIFITGLMVFFVGCTGPITGLEYTKKDFVLVYKVIKNGVVSFMTPEEIAEAKLDKIDMIVTDTYKVVRPEDLQTVQEVENIEDTENKVIDVQ